MNRIKNKTGIKLTALLLALVMVFAFSAVALADDITVTVSIENNTVTGDTLSGYSGWTGYLPTLAGSDIKTGGIDEMHAVSITVSSGATMMDAIAAALDAAGYTPSTTSGATYYCGASDGYLWSIGGLDSAALGGWSGWLGALNDTFPNLGFTAVYVENNDAIRVLYSDAYGGSPDPAIGYGAYNASGDFSCTPGVISVYPDSYGYGNELTITLPDSATTVTVTDTPADPEEEVRIYRYDSVNYTTDFSVAYGVDNGIPLANLGDEDILGFTFDALYIVTDNGALDGYCIYLRTAGDVITAALLDGCADALSASVTNWTIVATEAAGGTSLNYAEAASYVNSAVAYLLDADSAASTAALHVIALTAFGYDVSQIAYNGLDYDGFDELYALFAANETAWGGWTELYAYPLIALLNANDPDDYADEINTLIAELTPSGSGNWFTSNDSAGIALAALSMAADKGFSVNASVTDGLVTLLKGAVQTDGTLQALDWATSLHVSNAESTAMGIIGLDAAGEDVTAITASGSSDNLKNGLLLYAMGDDSGFNHSGGAYNTTASQQGALALVAMSDGTDYYGNVNATNVFDFQGNGTYPISINTGASDIEYDIVLQVYDYEDDLVTNSAGIKVYNSKGHLVSNNGIKGHYSLPLGSYTYIVSYSDHVGKSGSFIVTTDQTISVYLDYDGIEVTFRLIGAEETGLSDTAVYLTWYATRTYTVEEEATVYDLLKIALDDADLSYTWKNGYLTAVESPLTGDKLAEFDNGPDAGWMYVVNKKAPGVGMDDYELDEEDDVIVYYTNDYSEIYSGFSVKDVDPSKSALKSALKNAIEDAEDQLDTVVISSNGSTVLASVYWVTQAKYDELEDAIASAQKVYDKSSADMEAYQDAIRDLTAAIKTFKDAKNLGALYTISFSDVPSTYWAYDYIADLAAQGVLTGKTATLFAPGDTIKRGEFIVILARLSGETLPVYTGTFGDVSASAYYAQAVAWALTHGITTGTSANAFAPEALITREDMTVMLIRYAAYMDFDLPRTYTAISFIDQNEISAYAAAAVTAMQQAGIIEGRGYNLFAPKANATRAEAAKMIWMLDDLMD